MTEFTPAQIVWRERYRAPEQHEPDIASSFVRVAHALAAVEGRQAGHWTREFERLMAEMRFLPAGRILAGAGRERDTTLANCFVMGTLEDSIDGIFSTLKESALTLQANGGIGVDFSPLRPRGAAALRTAQTSSGAVSFLAIWNQMSETMLSTNPREGAMMGVLDCTHPDILDFIHAKQDPSALRHFNISVLVTEAFMQALKNGGEWPLRHNGKIYKTVTAQEIWQSILHNNKKGGEPGVLFIDRINAMNRMNYAENIRATNPCGELPLPPYGACLLGSVILPAFVRAPFTENAHFDFPRLEETVNTATRLLDNAVGIARFPLEQQRATALATRRIGIGVTGLANALTMLNLDYSAAEGRDTAAKIMARMRDTAFLTSTELAKEKGRFPALDTEAYLGNSTPPPLPHNIQTAIRKYGLRNSHLTAIAPAGSISLLAGNVSSGIEPVFDWSYTRRFGGAKNSEELKVTDYAARLWQEYSGSKPLPAVFKRQRDISAQDQIAMIAAIQAFVDSGISKTIGLPADAGPDAYNRIYQLAYADGLKGITTFPEAALRGAVLKRDADINECRVFGRIRCD